MTPDPISDTTASGPAEPKMFSSIEPSGTTYSEAFTASGTPHPHWETILSAMEADGPALLEKIERRAERMRHEDGATFNPFDDPTGRGTPWGLEIIPIPITAGEWEVIERGVLQRAQLLERILADTYGHQNLIKEGWMPPELVFANPNFLHTCHGILPTGNRFLICYAADLYRAADGRFRVYRDYGANVPGLGYALENRIVISRLFSRLYHNNQIRRLAPFFQSFHQSLIKWASLRQEYPGIVLLSPGPQSRTYFEHALLSRYLGYPLVEGEDLTVRNGKVYLKKLAGLEPVEAIVRYTADNGSDPFALRDETATGVAGLIQASREGNVEIVNPLGCGFLETPALQRSLPSLCRHLLGEELQLANHSTWWGGDPEGLANTLIGLDRLTVHGAMVRSSNKRKSMPSRQAIESTPHAFLASEPVHPSEAPFWHQGAIGTRPVFFRIFACATDEGFTVMPGGLALTASDVGTLTGDIPELQRSRDIWVLSEEPVVPFSLMGGLSAVPEFRRGIDLPSRVADHLLWLGRYLERAECIIRLLRSVFRRISGEARLGEIAELPFLLNLLRAEDTIPQHREGNEKPPPPVTLRAQLEDAIYAKRLSGSVAAILERVQAAAQRVRDRLSLDSWRVINRLEYFGDDQPEDPLDLLDRTLFTLSAFSGVAMESMTRGLGWRFMDMGRRVERGMNQTGLIKIGLSGVCEESVGALEALLEVSDSIMTYRARYRTAFQLAPVLDLLLVDETNPKSLAFQASRLEDHVNHLPRQRERRFATREERIILEMLTAIRLLDLTNIKCAKEETNFEALSEFLGAMDRRFAKFAQAVSAHYLTKVPATPHFSNLPETRVE